MPRRPSILAHGCPQQTWLVSRTVARQTGLACTKHMGSRCNIGGGTDAEPRRKRRQKDAHDREIGSVSACEGHAKSESVRRRADAAKLQFLRLPRTGSLSGTPPKSGLRTEKHGSELTAGHGRAGRAPQWLRRPSSPVFDRCIPASRGRALSWLGISWSVPRCPPAERSSFDVDFT